MSPPWHALLLPWHLPSSPLDHLTESLDRPTAETKYKFNVHKARAAAMTYFIPVVCNTERRERAGREVVTLHSLHSEAKAGSSPEGLWLEFHVPFGVFLKSILRM